MNKIKRELLEEENANCVVTNVDVKYYLVDYKYRKYREITRPTKFNSRDTQNTFTKLLKAKCSYKSIYFEANAFAFKIIKADL
jgi:hypothetical protein